MFQKGSEDGYVPVLEGIRRKTLAFGRSTLLTEFRLEKGALLPSHHHPHEQIGYLISGGLELTIGAATHRVEPGDGWCIPGGVPHRAVALADSVAVEVFSPLREDYLPPSAAVAGPHR